VLLGDLGEGPLGDLLPGHDHVECRRREVEQPAVLGLLPKGCPSARARAGAPRRPPRRRTGGPCPARCRGSRPSSHPLDEDAGRGEGALDVRDPAPRPPSRDAERTLVPLAVGGPRRGSAFDPASPSSRRSPPSGSRAAAVARGSREPDHEARPHEVADRVGYGMLFSSGRFRPRAAETRDGVPGGADHGRLGERPGQQPGGGAQS